MIKNEITIAYYTYEGAHELNPQSRILLDKAREALQTAYSPYSHFRVGAALRLSNGEVITASNQENAAYPSGMCAERSAIYYAGGRFPNAIIEEILVVACRDGEDELVPACPCGSCRQAMLEYEERQGKAIKIIFKKWAEGFIGLDSVSDTLPFKFGADSLGA
jgi:cytidine deaminase